MSHNFGLHSFRKIGKSFNILAFSKKEHRTIPIFLCEKPNYEVGFSSGAPPPRQSQKPPMDDTEDGLAPQWGNILISPIKTLI